LKSFPASPALRDIMQQLCIVSFLLVLPAVAGQQYVAFDVASASSTYSVGNLAGSPAFAAQQALSGGSGYWCSSGSHAVGQSVTWTGISHSRRVALGVKVNWAYAPGEVKVLTSSDGANFEEVKCWQSSSRKEVAFDESFMFDEPRNVKAVTITMRSAQSWGYFGINSAALIAEPGTFMLASGITSSAGEQCIVTGTSGIQLESCLEAIAAGDGREVLQFSKGGQIVNVATGTCLTLADGETAGGGALAMEPCSVSTESGDGRASFSLSPSGQLKMPHAGNYCVSFAGAGAARAVVQDCVEAEDNTDARDKFFMVGVPEFDPRAASAAKQSAALLNASEKHLKSLLDEIYVAMPSLAACGFKAAFVKHSLATSSSRQTLPRMGGSTQGQDDAAKAVAAVAPALGVDMQALRELVTSTHDALTQISR